MLALLGGGLLQELRLVEDRLLVGLQAAVDLLDHRLVALLGCRLRLEELRLLPSSVGQDLVQQLQHAAGARALRVGLRLRRRRLDCRPRHLGPSGLLADLGKGAALLRVEFCQARLGLLQDRLRRPLIGDALLEDEVLSLAVLAGPLQGDLHVGDLGLQCLDVFRQGSHGVLQPKPLALQVLLLLLLHLNAVLVLVDLLVAVVALLELGFLLRLQLGGHLVHCLLHLGEGVQTDPNG
mmetsp:Transcript_91363/g.263722  ORF Transcript_91363/g.263722 Transcript_91363/m.263722 type:complete len:237 (-) Transcript_91363:1312-2022(-)